MLEYRFYLTGNNLSGSTEGVGRIYLLCQYQPVDELCSIQLVKEEMPIKQCRFRYDNVTYILFNRSPARGSHKHP